MRVIQVRSQVVAGTNWDIVVVATDQKFTFGEYEIKIFQNLWVNRDDNDNVFDLLSFDVLMEEDL